MTSSVGPIAPLFGLPGGLLKDLGVDSGKSAAPPRKTEESVIWCASYPAGVSPVALALACVLGARGLKDRVLVGGLAVLAGHLDADALGGGAEVG